MSDHTCLCGAGVLLIQVIPIWISAFTAAVIINKWFWIGRYRAGNTRIHSLYYMRWWMIDRLVAVWEIVIGAFITDTIFMNVVYRLMGSNVAWSASISQFYREFDLVTIGSSSSISGWMYPHQFDKDRLHFGPIVLGHRVSLQSQCVMELRSRAANDVYVLPLSVVPANSSLPAGTTWQGNPLRQVLEAARGAAAATHDVSTLSISIPDSMLEMQRLGVHTSCVGTQSASSSALLPDDASSMCHDDRSSPNAGHSARPGTVGSEGSKTSLQRSASQEDDVPLAFSWNTRWCALHICKLITLALLVHLSNVLSTPVVLLVSYIPWDTEFRYLTLCIFLIRVYGALIVFCVFTLCAKWVLAGRSTAGLYSFTFFREYRRWLLDLFATVSTVGVLNTFSPFPVWAYWLQLLGAKIHSSVISINHSLVHIEDADMLQIGQGSFLSAGVFRPDMASKQPGYREKRKIAVGEYCQVGFRCIVDGDTELDNFCVVGARTMVPRGTHAAAGTTLAGVPATSFGTSVKSMQGVSDHILRATRLRRCLVPILSTLGDVFAIAALFGPLIPAYEVGRWLYDNVADGQLYVMSWSLSIAVFIVCSQCTRVLLKWLIIGRYKQARYGLSDFFLHSYHAATANQYNVQVTSCVPLEGTILYNFILRCLGARVGSNVVLIECAPKEEDQLVIEDNVVAERTEILGHKFENYGLNIGPLRLCAGAVIRPKCILMADTIIPNDVVLGSGSTLFPGQSITAGQFWIGSPAQRMRRS